MKVMRALSTDVKWPSGTWTVLFGLATVVVCCKDGGSSGAGTSTLPDVGPRMDIDNRGGIAAVTDINSTLYGTTISIPPGALSQKVQIGISEETSLPMLSGSEGTGSTQLLTFGPVLSLEPDGLEFETPVTVRLPLPEGVAAGNVHVARFDPEQGVWMPVADSFAQAPDIGETNAVAQAVFQTSSFSLYRAYYDGVTECVIVNSGSSRADVRIIGHRTVVSSDPAWVPIPLDDALYHALLEPSAGMPIGLLPGDYLIEALYDDEDAPVCETMTVAAGGEAAAILTETLPRCDRPVVSLTASALTVRYGEEITLTASATATAERPLTTWYWTRTGGMVKGSQSGTMSSGDTITTTWTAPNTRGSYTIYLTVYDTLGWFGEDSVTIQVTGANNPPEFESFVADPWQIEPAPNNGIGTVIPTDILPQGVSLITVTATDPDGDTLSYYWYPTDFGSFFDSATGQILDTRIENGLVLTATGEPYSAPSILYVAPEVDFIGNGSEYDNFPLGIWVGLWAIVTDGDISRMTWGMVDVVPEGSLEADKDCVAAKTHLCENIQKQNCSTFRMTEAVAKVSDACGSTVSSSFSSAASSYCQSSGSSFSVSECAAQ